MSTAQHSERAVTRDESTRVLDAIKSEHQRTAKQITSLERSVTAIVEAAELTATDDEHDPEGATIAYERAQATALLRQARIDLGHLVDAQSRLESGEPIVCEVCGRAIGLERIMALPTAHTCLDCAR